MADQRSATAAGVVALHGRGSDRRHAVGARGLPVGPGRVPRTIRGVRSGADHLVDLEERAAGVLGVHLHC